jgi:hypothetical protein
MRHSIFFDDCEAANSAERQVQTWIETEDLYQMNDGETGIIEVRFFTAKKLDRYQIGRLPLRRAVSYALNCED